MALTLNQPDIISDLGPMPAAEAREKTIDVQASKASSRAVVGFGVMAASIVLVQLATMVMMLVLTDISVLAAAGFGLYCAFWLGIGFGTIFGAAAAFGGEH